jgi:hypothetical protein
VKAGLAQRADCAAVVNRGENHVYYDLAGHLNELGVTHRQRE